MKKTIILILFLTISVLSVYSQPLSFNNLLFLRGETLNNVETFLLKRNWQFASSRKETDTLCAIVAFTLDTRKSQESLQYLYSESDKFQRLFYTTFNKSIYIQLTNQANIQKYKFQKSKIEGESLSNLFYKKGSYLICTSFHFETNKSTPIIMYKIEFYKEEDFNKISAF